jgi:hypothetical protein
MTALFIANLTKQNNHLHYRLPEVARLLDEVIPYGGQVQIAKHLNPTKVQLQGIIDQHKEHGLVDVKTAVQSRNGKINLVYSWDKPVDIDAIHFGLDRNDNEALKISDEVRETQAASTIDKLAKDTGKEPEIADFTLSEVVETGGKKKSTVVREVGKAKA